MMKQNIHFKINTDDKKKLILRAKELGLCLSSYIRLELMKAIAYRDFLQRDLMSHYDFRKDDLI